MENNPSQQERIEATRQECETVLGLLESHFLESLISGNWAEFDRFVDDFRGDTTFHVPPKQGSSE